MKLYVLESNILAMPRHCAACKMAGADPGGGVKEGFLTPPPKNLCMDVNRTVYVMKISPSNVLSVTFSCST